MRWFPATCALIAALSVLVALGVILHRDLQELVVAIRELAAALERRR